MNVSFVQFSVIKQRVQNKLLYHHMCNRPIGYSCSIVINDSDAWGKGSLSLREAEVTSLWVSLDDFERNWISDGRSRAKD